MDQSTMIERGALVFVSHSGGKDSQAMYSHLMATVPAAQVVVVHANLGAVEWSGVMDHIKANTSHPLNVVRAVWKDGTEKTLLNMVERRHAARPDVAPWPSPQYRQCTSDLKRGPIQKFIRAEMKRRGATLAINAMGFRAEESSARAKRSTWSLNKDLSKAGRTVHDWLPIHDWTAAEVFAEIARAEQQPFHAYAEGNQRLSCVFCIMGCKGDLQNGAKQNPQLLAKYIELEQRTGYTMFATESLAARIETKHDQPHQKELF